MRAASFSLEALVGREWPRAIEARAAIPELAAASAGIKTGEGASWAQGVLSRSLSLTLLAGSGTRWQASLAAARAEGRLNPSQLSFDPSSPRGLFPVADFIEPGRGSPIPIAAYSIRAVSALGGHVIVIRDHEAEIRREVLRPLDLDEGAWRLAFQEAPFGKPLGHGDAAWQCRAQWRDAEWVVANFGGDANSRFTVEASLQALAALDAAGLGLDFLLPAALLPEAAYPISLDGEGRPLTFGHAKLQGAEFGGGRSLAGLANVGLRLYRAKALAELLEELHDSYWVEGKGYSIPGNDPASRECALDNADAVFAARGRARVLAIARPRELSPAKSFDEIPRFEAAIAAVLEEDRALLPSR